jgi:hypothetical protein
MTWLQPLEAQIKVNEKKAAHAAKMRVFYAQKKARRTDDESERLRRRALALRRAGLTFREIAQELGVSKQQAHHYWQKYR